MNTDNFTIWQRRECGAFCRVRHTHTASPANRACVGEEAAVPLSMSTAHAGGENLGPVMATVVAVLEQGPREREPHVNVSLPTEVESLTLDEAERLSSVLARLVHEGREAAKEVDWR